MRGIRWYSGKARWFRSTTAPIAKPAQFRYKPKEKPGGFEPFAEQDSLRLERAFGKGLKECTIQKDGLYKVNLDKRHYTSTYWEGPVYKVLRGTWFIKGSKLTPVDEETAAEIEAKYQQGETKFKLESGETVELTTADNKTTGSIISTDRWTDMIKSLQFSGTQSIVRGYEDPKKLADPKKPATKENKTPSRETIVNKLKRKTNSSKMEDNVPLPETSGEVEREIKHLVLAIHGIGQQLGIRYEFVNFVKDTDEMRSLMNQVFSRNENLQLAARSKTNHGIQVLPVLWRHLLPKSAKNLDPKLEGLTVPQLMAKDNILADVALDYVMYTHQEYRESMIKVTARELNRVYHEFCKNNPEFAKNPRVSLAGHSLGSVIANDLLRSESVSLDFEVENLFFLGSPVGCLQYLTGKSFTKDGLNAKNVYNILRPSDPIGARIEPLVNKAAVIVEPQKIPASDKILAQIKDLTEDLTALGLSISAGATVLWKQIAADSKAGEKKEQSERIETQQEVDPATTAALQRDLACFNRYKRLDFSVPESVDISLILAIAGHTMYFDNYDLASFVMGELLNVQVEPKTMVRAASDENDIESS